jgi:hypothetical protein
VHPVDRPVFQPLMLLSAIAGAVFTVFYDANHGSTPYGVLAGISFACFVVLFGLYWLGWLLREHELWREGRRQEVD